MIAFAGIEAFYGDDERRRRGRELDFGVWWRHRGVVYRITWVDATGELIAVQLSPPVVRALVDDDKAWPVGFAVFGGDAAGFVYVLAIVEDEHEVEQLLDGWAEVCGKEDSLAWLLGRVAGNGGLG